MAEVSYDIPRENLLDEPTSGTFPALAGLAKEALANRFGMTASSESMNAIPRADTFAGLLGDESTYIGNFPTAPLEPKYLKASMSGSRPNYTIVDTFDDEMSSDQYLVFLSLGEVEEFLRPLIQRIEELARLAREEEDQQALRARSLRGFFKFLYLHRPRIESRPQLTLTTEGYLRAIWRKSRDHRIAVRFADDTRVSFVTFLPDRARPTQINRVGGNSSVDSFFENTGIEGM